MLDLIFKIKKNIPSFIRGGLIYIFSKFHKGILIKGHLRVAKNAELIRHPGCHITIKNGMSLGKGSLISVLPNGKLIVGEKVGIGRNCQIVCHNRIVIGDNTILGPNVMLFDHNHKYDLTTGVKPRTFDIGEITIGKNCWIGSGCIILKDVHIGDNSIVAAGSVVTKDVPFGTVVAGIPARIIKTI